MSNDWIGRLEHGVRSDELLEFFVLAGLPLSTACRIINADTEDARAAPIAWPDRSLRFRRAVVGILCFFVLSAAVLGVLSGQSIVNAASTALLFLLAAVVVYQAIVRLSPGFR